MREEQQGVPDIGMEAEGTPHSLDITGCKPLVEYIFFPPTHNIPPGGLSVVFFKTSHSLPMGKVPSGYIRNFLWVVYGAIWTPSAGLPLGSKESAN